MFSGLVEQMGQVTQVGQQGSLLRLTVEPEQPWSDLQLGESIAINGTCLTVVAFSPQTFQVELSPETLKCTAGPWTMGQRVNLERALAVGARLGGHVVTGHVDGVGVVEEILEQQPWRILRIRGPQPLARFWVPKGSVTVEGVSLTLVDVGGPLGRPDLDPTEFTVWLIPHTLEKTTLHTLQAGSPVNLEADILAKYTQRAQALEALS